MRNFLGLKSYAIRMLLCDLVNKWIASLNMGMSESDRHHAPHTNDD